MTEIYPDTGSRPSAVIVEAKLGGAPSLDITRPLIMYTEKDPGGGARQMTEEGAASTGVFCENLGYFHPPARMLY